MDEFSGQDNMSKTETQHEEIRIIIIGASRSGKSTAANVLLGKNIFQVSADTRQRSHMTCQFGMTKTEHGYVKVSILYSCQKSINQCKRSMQNCMRPRQNADKT